MDSFLSTYPTKDEPTRTRRHVTQRVSQGVQEQTVFPDRRCKSDIASYKLCLLFYQDLGRNYGGTLALQNNSNIQWTWNSSLAVSVVKAEIASLHYAGDTSLKAREVPGWLWCLAYRKLSYHAEGTGFDPQRWVPWGVDAQSCNPSTVERNAWWSVWGFSWSAQVVTWDSEKSKTATRNNDNQHNPGK